MTCDALALKKRILYQDMGEVANEIKSEVIFEFRFHTVRKWRFDVAFPVKKIALEIEGGVWTRGRHTRGAGFLGDMKKYNTATLMGWRVLRCTWDDVMDGKAKELIREAMEAIPCEIIT